MTQPKRLYPPLAFLAGLLLLASLACQAVTGAPTAPTAPDREATVPAGLQETATSRPPQSTAQPETSEPGAEPTSLPAGALADPLLPSAEVDRELLEGMSHYTITVNVQVEQLTFSGEQVVAYTNTEDEPLESLYFRLFPNGGASYGNGSLDVSQVSAGGQTLETQLSLDDSVLEVQLPEAIQPGEQLAVEMQFAGELPEDFGGGYGIYNSSNQVLSMAGWYPILAVYDDEGWNLDPVSNIGDSVYADMALYTVDVQIDQQVVLVATGAAAGLEQAGGSTRGVFASGPVREFYMIMSPRYEVASQTVDGVTVNSYYYEGMETAGQYGLSVAVDSLQIFNQAFGPYPYTELDVAAAPMVYAAGVEFPGVIIVVDDAYQNAGPNTFFPVIVAHEVAHQWWYNLVGNDVLDNPWLDEGLTTFSSTLYFQEVLGEQAYQQMIQNYQRSYQNAVANGRDDLVTAGLEHFEQPGAGDYSTVVYTKGALFFYEVRQTIGDEAFFEALQNYFAANRYRIAEPEGLLSAFEQAAGRQLDDLYEEWLYSTNNP